MEFQSRPRISVETIRYHWQDMARSTEYQKIPVISAGIASS